MPLTSGQKLAHFEVLEAIGAGGMGEVYRARVLGGLRDALPRRRQSHPGLGGSGLSPRLVAARRRDPLRGRVHHDVRGRTTEPGFRAGARRELFEAFYPRRAGRSYDVTADGDRFVFLLGSTGGGQQQIHVVLNWLEELEARAPAE